MQQQFSPKKHNEALKKLRKLVDKLGVNVIAQLIEKHPTHVTSVVAGQRTMKDETCDSVFALYNKTFIEATIEEVLESPVAVRRGRKPLAKASNEEIISAREKLRQLSKTIGLSAAARRLDRSEHTLRSFMYGAQRAGKELCDSIISLDIETPLPAVEPRQRKERAEPVTEEVKTEKPQPKEAKPKIVATSLNTWDGTLSKDQAKRVQVICRHVARKVGRGRDSFNGFSIEDLEQAGIVRCVEASKRFDPNKSQFNTFFNIHAQSGIRDFLRDIDTLSRSQREKVKVGKAADAQTVYIEDIFKSNGDSSGSDRESFQPPFHDEKPKEVDDVNLLKVIVDNTDLTDDEKLVLDMHQHELNMKEIGTLFGYSESRASQVIDSIIMKLKSTKRRLRLESDFHD